MKKVYWRRYPQLTSEYRRITEDQLMDEFVGDYNLLRTYLTKVVKRPDLMGEAVHGLHKIQRVIIKLQLARLREKRRDRCLKEMSY